MSQPPSDGEWPPNGEQPSGQPPNPPGYGQQPNQPPAYGQQPGQPPPGQQPYGQAPYGQQPGQPPAYGQQPYSQAPYEQQSNQPSYGQQPYGQAPYGQAPYGQDPYGQPPKRSPLLLIIGIAVGVLVLVGGGVFAAFAVLGGDGGDSDSDDGFAASSEKVEGDGYTYPLPEDWYDLSDDMSSEQTSAGLDTFAGEENDADKPETNVLVEIDDLPGETDLESLRDQWQQNISAALTDPEVEELDDITIDGEDAIGVRSVGENAEGIEVTQDAYLALADDKAYTIALSYETKNSDEYDDYLADLLGEWTWE